MNYDHLEVSEAPWVVYIDKKKSKPYYYDHTSKKTVWDEPDEFKTWKNIAIDKYLKNTTWRRASNEDGRVYYFDKTTKKSQWHAPKEVVDFETYLQNLSQTQLKNKKSISADTKACSSSTGESSSSNSHVAEISVKVDNKDIAKEVPAKISQEKLSDTKEDVKEVEQEEEEEYESVEGTPEQDYNDDDDDEENLYGDNMMVDRHDYSYTNTDHAHGSMMTRYNAMEVVGEEDLTVADATINNDEEIKTLTSILSKRDSIMEPNVVANTKRLRTLTNEDPLTTINRLSENYIGLASMSNIVTEWLIVARLLNQESSLFKPQPHPSSDIMDQYKKLHDEQRVEINKMIMHELATMIKHKFDRSAADAVILKVSDIPPWLLAMMNDDILRKTLIELYNMNTDSTLLGFVLRQLSKLGYHNEIAHIIREFEYLEVFDDIIVDQAKRLSRAATYEEINAIANDIKKNSAANEYIFLYTNEILFQLEYELRSIANNSDPIQQAHRIALASRIHRIQQDLEDQEIWSKLPSSSMHPSSSTLLTKPAMCLRLIQQQSLLNGCHINTISTHIRSLMDVFMEVLSLNSINDNLLSKLFLFYNYRSSIDASTIDDPSSRFQEFTPYISLLQHHHVVRILTKSFIHPKSIINPGQLSYLLALASCCSRSSRVSVVDWKQVIRDIDAVENQLLVARQHSRDLLIKGLDIKDYAISEELSSLMHTPIITFILLHWIEYCTITDTMSDITSIHTTSMVVDLSFTAYLGMVPFFYELIVQACNIYHIVPHHIGIQSSSRYHHHYAFKVLTSILSKLMSSNTSLFDSELIENNNELVQRLVRDGYECIIFIMSVGYTFTPIQYIIDTIDTLDADVVRFVISSLLPSVKHPFSIMFLGKMIGLLSTASIKKEMTKKDNFLLLQQFEQEVLKGLASASLDSLLGDDDDDNNDATSAKYQELASNIQSLVLKYKSTFKY